MNGEWWTRRNSPQKVSSGLGNALMLLVLLLAVWLRFWQLKAIPPGLWFDEAYYAMDAVWLRDTNTWPVFLLGNNGRESMFSYLLAWSTAVWGETAYIVRWVSAWLGVLAIPIMYRWVFTILGQSSKARWLALLSAAGLAVSFWHVTMSRSGYRANLLPLFILMVSYFFWRGWQTGQTRYYLLAGLGLGLSQYTYLSVRLFPLVFVLFLFIQTLLSWRDELARLKTTWLQLCLMGGMSVLVATPLLFFFIDHPEAFWGRVSDVALKTDWSVEGLGMVGLHLLAAIRVFIDGEDPNWRHHLVGRPAFDWLCTLGFWLGLFIAVKKYRYPAYLFLLLSLFVMWLPAPLSEPAVHTLRLSGILPAYYVFVAVGLLNLINWLKVRWLVRGPFSTWRAAGLAALLALLLFSGGSTIYDYFYRWANATEVYQAYDGPVVTLADYLTSPSARINLIIPFYLYSHASMRYLLHNDYREEVLLPKDNISPQKEASLLIPEYPPDDNLPPAFVWLIKDRTNPGVAYVSEVERGLALANSKSEPIETIKDGQGKIIARLYQIDTRDVLALFPAQLPLKKAAYEWADNLILTGYDFVPSFIKVGAWSTLHLSWKILGYTDLPARMFIQLLDNQGNPVGQKELAPISRKMYRWRKAELILEQYPLDFGTPLKPSLYFVRLGFFDAKTHQRLPVYDVTKQPAGDEVILGPFYVYDESINPTIPQYPLQARLGDAIEIVGYALSPGGDNVSTTEVQIYWKAVTPVDRNYTAFVQLLDDQNKVLTQQDHQPLANIYPTSLWQPGDILVDKFTLPVSVNELSNINNQLVTGMYDLSTGIRLPAYSHKGELMPDGLVQLVK